MTWIYKDKEIHSHDDLLPGCTDFVYVITYNNGQKYIGKKTVASFRTKPPLKGKKRNRRIWTKLPFLKYAGSHDKAKDLEPVTKEILYQSKSKKTATYIEAALLFEHDAIFDESYINENISGTFYNNSLDGLLTEET